MREDGLRAWRDNARWPVHCSEGQLYEADGRFVGPKHVEETEDDMNRRMAKVRSFEIIGLCMVCSFRMGRHTKQVCALMEKKKKGNSRVCGEQKGLY